ncbi:MAG: hypothetical protein WBP34_08375 [Thermoanaerobaculia bacterium]
MNEDGSAQSLAERVLSGENRELQLLIARGMFPLPVEMLIPLQIRLSNISDEEVAAAAVESLGHLDPEIAVAVVAESDEVEVVSYFASRTDQPPLAETVIQHRLVSSQVLSEMAVVLSPELQEILLLRQDAILEDPKILERLEENPELSSYAKRRIREYREHLLPRQRGAAAEEAAEVELEEPTDEEIEEAITWARKEPAKGEMDEVTGLSEAQIRTLPIPVRLKLSRGASRTLRNILVKDKNPMVAVSVMTGNAMGDGEVELIASSKVVADEVLEVIARSRQWGRRYSIVHTLVKNPRMPAGLAARLVPRLGVRDLRVLSRDRNVSEVVRSTATRLYRIKSK